MKIFVAIPTYDGKLFSKLSKCLMDEKIIAHGLGDELCVSILPGCSHPAMGRNQLAQDFMESDFDRLFFLDSDITFDLGAIIKTCHMPFDFVGGGYRYKFETENYPVGWLNDPEKKGLWTNEYGLLEVHTLPGGFMALSKNVFGKIKEKFPDRGSEHFGKKTHAYFSMPFESGHLWGEDSHFCKLWRETGGQIYIDPELELTHWNFDPVPFKGHIGNWLKNRSAEK